jgi:hypothetical protein
MSETLDERARAASQALLAAVELRPRADVSKRTRPALRVAAAAAVVVVAVSVAAVFAFRSPSTTSVGRSNGAVSDGQYRASAVLVEITLKSGARENLSQDAFLLTVGVVPARVAKLVNYPGNPAGLVTHTKSTVDTKINTITILVTMPTAAKAEAIANAFAEQLVGYLRDVSRGELDLQVVGLLQNQTTLTQALKPILATLDQLKAKGKDDAILETKRQSLITQFRRVVNQYEALRNGSVDTPRYRIIEASHATSLAQGTATSTEADSHRTITWVVVVAVLILLGAVLAVLRRKFDLSVTMTRKT